MKRCCQTLCSSPGEEPHLPSPKALVADQGRYEFLLAVRLEKTWEVDFCYHFQEFSELCSQYSPFHCYLIAREHTFTFSEQSNQCSLLPPCRSHLVSDIRASSVLMARPLVVITGHCFYPTDPPEWQRHPSIVLPEQSLVFNSPV